MAMGTPDLASAFSSLHVDLTGKLIIKAQLEDDIRRIPIHNEDITYDELVLMMQRVFAGRIRSSDDLLIRYRDDDGDLVTILDNPDLTHAKAYGRILRLVLTVRSEKGRTDQAGSKPCAATVASLRKELESIRSTVDTLLDALKKDEGEAKASDTKPDKGAPKAKQDAPAPAERLMFDPLMQAQQAQDKKAPPAAVPTAAPAAAAPTTATGAQGQPAAYAPAAAGAPPTAASAASFFPPLTNDTFDRRASIPTSQPVAAKAPPAQQGPPQPLSQPPSQPQQQAVAPPYQSDASYGAPMAMQQGDGAYGQNMQMGGMPAYGGPMSAPPTSQSAPPQQGGYAPPRPSSQQASHPSQSPSPSSGYGGYDPSSYYGAPSVPGGMGSAPPQTGASQAPPQSQYGYGSNAGYGGYSYQGGYQNY